jgi:hypothetical protein
MKRRMLITPSDTEVRRHLRKLGCSELQIQRHLARGKLKERSATARPTLPHTRPFKIHKKGVRKHANT